MSDIDLPIALYRTMSTPELLALRACFVMDAWRECADERSVKFCAGRIALIDLVLDERRDPICGLLSDD